MGTLTSHSLWAQYSHISNQQRGESVKQRGRNAFFSIFIPPWKYVAHNYWSWADIARQKYLVQVPLLQSLWEPCTWMPKCRLLDKDNSDIFPGGRWVSWTCRHHFPLHSDLRGYQWQAQAWQNSIGLPSSHMQKTFKFCVCRWTPCHGLLRCWEK